MTIDITTSCRILVGDESRASAPGALGGRDRGRVAART